MQGCPPAQTRLETTLFRPCIRTGLRHLNTLFGHIAICATPANCDCISSPTCMTARPTACFSELMRVFFNHHLPYQRELSPRTIESYRDALRLLVEFIRGADGKAAAQRGAGRSDARSDPAAFLTHLEQVRHNSRHSRNIRLAAVRGVLKFAAPWDASPRQAISQSLKVPMTRFVRPRPDFLSREQMQAIIGVHDCSWIAQRDHLMLSLLYNTAASVSEMQVRLRVDQDIELDGAGLRALHGTRRARSVPLRRRDPAGAARLAAASIRRSGPTMRCCFRTSGGERHDGHPRPAPPRHWRWPGAPPPGIRSCARSGVPAHRSDTRRRSTCCNAEPT